MTIHTDDVDCVPNPHQLVDCIGLSEAELFVGLNYPSVCFERFIPFEQIDAVLLRNAAGDVKLDEVATYHVCDIEMYAAKSQVSGLVKT